jgi:hypothetical protein
VVVLDNSFVQHNGSLHQMQFFATVDGDHWPRNKRQQLSLSRSYMKNTVLRIRDVYPGSRISDPGSKNGNKREEWKKIWCYTIFCSHKFHIIENYFIFETLLKKIIWATKHWKNYTFPNHKKQYCTLCPCLYTRTKIIHF